MQNLQRWEVDDSQRNVSNALGPDPPHNWPQSTKRQIQCQPPAPQTPRVSGFFHQRQTYFVSPSPSRILSQGCLATWGIRAVQDGNQGSLLVSSSWNDFSWI